MSTETAKNEVTKKGIPASEHFTNLVVAEFGSGVGEITLTDFQKRLAQNYFIAIDATLKTAEEKRAKKSERYRDPLPIAWGNVNMPQLARNVVAYARIGLDPAQKNHINMMPFKNNNTNKYDIVFIEGYRGIELKSKKYGLEIPDHVIVELVYSTDNFRSIKKDRNNAYESFEFEITNDFDRGEIIGGFYYHIFSNNPGKNKLVVMPLKEILKRKPNYASVEFWGGEKDVWEDGKKTGKKEQVEGWYEKMCWKTVYRAAYGDITIDSQKIDDNYLRLSQMEASLTEIKVSQEISENANGEVVDITDYKATDAGDIPPHNEPPDNQVDLDPAASGDIPY